MLYREESTFRRMEDTSYRSNSTFLVCSPRSFRVEIRRGVRRILMYFLKKCTYVYIYIFQIQTTTILLCETVQSLELIRLRAGTASSFALLYDKQRPRAAYSREIEKN